MNTLKHIGKTIYAGWMKFAHVLGLINTTILLTVVYFLPFGITALIRRFGGNPFTPKGSGDSYYQDHDSSDHSSLEAAERQF